MEIYLEYKFSPIYCLAVAQGNILGVILDSFPTVISLVTIFIDFHFLC